METESTPLSDQWSLQSGVSGALGNGYYEWKHGNQNQGIDKPGKGILTYTFQIQTPGTYRLILRSAAPHKTEHNDVWAQFTRNETVGRKSNGDEVDLGQSDWFKVYQNKGNDSWNWAASTVDHNAHNIFALIETPGEYELQLSGRSTLFKVDRIVLFHESVSQGAATSLENQESPCHEGEPPALRTPDTPPNTTPGLQYAYFEGEWDELPDFASLDPVKTGFTSDIDLSPRNRDNNFGFIFEGYITAPSDGVYTFYTRSDDGSKLFIGDQQVVNNDGIHAAKEALGTIGLQEGLHLITIHYFEGAGNEELTVSWTPPGENKEDINATAFVYDPEDLLPVELTSFTALIDAPGVILAWETASELNNAGFSIERSIDSPTAFTPIDFVEGAGSTLSPHMYAYRDETLPIQANTLYYRLRQVDFDGSFAYSPVVSVQIPVASQANLFPNYPNPFNPTTALSFTLPVPGTVKLSVYDTTGRLIETLLDEAMEAGFHEVMYNAPSSLSSGTYLYRLETPHAIQTGSMALLK